MPKLSINVPAAYEAALVEWANEQKDKKASLAAQLVRLCLEARYPGRFPAAPPILPGSDRPSPTIPQGTLLSDLIRMSRNLEGGVIDTEALLVQALTDHFAGQASKYHTKICALTAQHGLNFEQAYVLLTRRTYPYDETDVEWAKQQLPVLSEEQFLQYLGQA